MMLNEWKPIDNADGRFDLERLEDNTDNLSILLRSQNTSRILRIIFDSALCYRNIDEGDLLKSLQEGKIKGGFYTITDSLYLEWFHEESFGTRRDENVCHYGIYTPNDSIDIISPYPPEVEWLD